MELLRNLHIYACTTFLSVVITFCPVRGAASPLNIAAGRQAHGVDEFTTEKLSFQPLVNAGSAQLSNAWSLPQAPNRPVAEARCSPEAEQRIDKVNKHLEQIWDIVRLASSPTTAVHAVVQPEQTADEFQLVTAELAAHAGYSIQRILPRGDMFHGSRALQVQCKRTNRLRTILQIPRQQLHQLDSLQQAQVVEALQHTSGLYHPHMLQVYEVFSGPLHLHIVLEECSAGRLLDFPSKQARAWATAEEGAAEPEGAGAGAAGRPPALTLDFARWFFQQVVLAVDYYHAKGKTCLGIEHTMLKVVPNLPQPVVKVPTQILAQGVTSLSHAATQEHSDFVPPELRCAGANSVEAGGTAAEAAPAAAVDVWACGVLLLKLLGGHLQCHNTTHQHQHLSCPGPVFVLPACVQQEAPVGFLELLQGMLCIDPMRRVKLSDVLKSSWFQQGLAPSAADMTARYIAKSNPCRQPAANMEAVVQHAVAADMQQTTGMNTAPAEASPAEALQNMQHKQGDTCRFSPVCLQHHQLTGTVITQPRRQQQGQAVTQQPSQGSAQQCRRQSATDQGTALMMPEAFGPSSTAATVCRCHLAAVLFGGWMAGLVLLHHWLPWLAPQHTPDNVLVADVQTHAATFEDQDTWAVVAARHVCCCLHSSSSILTR